MAKQETSETPQGPVTLTFDQLKELLSSRGGSREDLMEVARFQAEETAKAQKKLLRPENEHHPAISDFSYPEGDQARPRPPLVPKDTYWCGALCEHSSLKAEEIELLNQLEPGEFVCAKADGTKIPVTVKGEWDAAKNGWRKKEVWFQTKGQARFNLMPMVVMLREMVAQQTSAVV